MTKEIGIRKILGASILQLWQLLTKDFIQLILLACLIAISSSYLFMEKWLEQYSYKTTIDLGIIVYSALTAIGITLITVSFKTIKAAVANPVDSLKDE